VTQEIPAVRRPAVRPVRVSLAAAAITVAVASPSFGATYTFVPSAGTTPNTTGTANWTDPGSWVNSGTANTTGTVPGSGDTVGSATGATTLVNTAVPTINELRFANAVAGTNIGSTGYVSTGDATLDIEAGGAVTIMSTNGTSNGDAWFGRAQPSGGHLIINGGSLTTGSTKAITNDAAANVNIGDIAGTASGSTGAANSTFAITGGTLTSGNNLIVGNSFAAPNLFATGTVTQTGGTVNVAGAVQVGANGNGTYAISAGTLNQQGTNPDGSALGRDAFFVGRNGNGTGNPGATGSVMQSGTAVVTVANGLYIANNSNTTGSYTVSGGTLTVAGEIKVGASTNSTGTVAATNNIGSFNIVGNAAPTITANGLTADTANSTLSFTVNGAAGTTLLDLVGTASDSAHNGAANLSSATAIDLQAGNGFTPVAGETFQLIRASAINTLGGLPSLATDTAFAGWTLSVADNTDGTESLDATLSSAPEPTSAVLLAVATLPMTLGRRRRRCPPHPQLVG
jgi:hypothetical protein